MAHLPLSSGDVVADRRADYARMLAETGDGAAAADLMQQALELVPDWPAGWLQLGDYRVRAGQGQAAAEAYRRLLALDPDDLFGAGLKLALLGAAPLPAQPSSRYVEALFDDYADRFDSALVDRLQYRVPQMLAATLDRVTTDRGLAGHCFARGIDLGCGTGLMAAALRARVAWLEGYDLSEGMLAKARAKQLYDHLGVADLAKSEEASGLFSPAGGLGTGRADLVTAADVLMYLGALSGIFAQASALLQPAGWLLFSVEAHPGPEPFVLAPSLRYQHAAAYVEACLADAGLDLLDREAATIRMDGGKPVAGMLFVALKPG